MHHARLALLCIACVACTQAPAQPTAVAKKSKVEQATDRLVELTHRADPALASLAWLTGSWATRDMGGVTLEAWDVARGSLMLGHGQSYDQARTTFFEYMRIAADSDGIALHAQPGGGAPTVFRLKEQGRLSVTFHNPQHDFPQVIGYAREGSLLRVHLEGDRGKNRQIVDLSYRCVGGACR